VLSLFAGVGARSAKAAVPFTATPASGVFAGGAAATILTAATASFTLGGTITAGNVAMVTWQDTLLVTHSASYTVLGTEADLAAVATALAALVAGTATATATGAVVTVTQAVAGTLGNGRTFAVATTGTLTATPASGVFAGGIDVAGATAATASLTLSGTVATGDTATVTVEGVAPVTYTLLATDTTLALVATNLAAAVTGATATGAVVTLTWAATGIIGNGKTFAATTTNVAPLSITPSSLPAGTVGTAYTTTTLDVTGGTAPYTWTVTGALPAGLSLSSAQVLSGTPTVAGISTITVNVVDLNGLAVTAALSITIAAAVPVVVPVVGATTALTVTSSGAFTGGVDGIGVAPVDAVGTVTALVDSTHVTVDVTTAGVGMFGGPGNVTLTKYIPLTTTSTSAGWATLGQQYITFTAGTLPIVGDEVTVTASTTNGVGTVLMLGATVGGLTTDLVNVTTAKIGTLAGVVTVMRESPAIITSTDPDWLTVGTANITFADASLLAVDDGLYVTMAQLQAAQKAYAYLTLNGAVSGANITAGTVATATWQDTTGASHTASYTVLAGDSLATVITKFINAINATAGGLVTAAPYGTSSIKLTQTVKGAVGNGKTLTAGTTAAATALTILTLGGLGQPAYVEVGKTIQLVAVDSTGAIVAPVWTLGTGAPATINSNGLLRAMTDSGVTLVTATSGSLTGTFVIVNIPTQTITKLTVILVPATLKVAGKQQFGAIAASSGYSALDYTTQAAWTDTLPVGVISNAAPTQGLLTYSTAETGDISALAAGLTSTATATIDATGVVTVKAVPVTVTKVIVLTVGTDIVTVDGKATSVDAAPEIVNGRTFVPIRFIAETFGSTVTWLPETKGVTIVLGTTTIGLQIGNATAVINANVITLEAAPYIKNSRTMVPLRVISESFGGDVVWDAALRTITITYTVPAPVPAP
jgi:hypothetical protein